MNEFVNVCATRQWTGIPFTVYSRLAPSFPIISFIAPITKTGIKQFGCVHFSSTGLVMYTCSNQLENPTA